MFHEKFIVTIYWASFLVSRCKVWTHKIIRMPCTTAKLLAQNINVFFKPQNNKGKNYNYEKKLFTRRKELEGASWKGWLSPFFYQDGIISSLKQKKISCIALKYLLNWSCDSLTKQQPVTPVWKKLSMSIKLEWFILFSIKPTWVRAKSKPSVRRGKKSWKWEKMCLYGKKGLSRIGRRDVERSKDEIKTQN